MKYVKRDAFLTSRPTSALSNRVYFALSADLEFLVNEARQTNPNICYDPVD